MGSDPIGAALRALARARRGVSVELFRAAAAATLGHHFLRLLLETWPLLAPESEQHGLLRTAPSAPVLAALHALGLLACVLSFGGFARRASALGLFAVTVISLRALRPIAHLDDFLALWLAGWLALCPIASANVWSALRRGAGTRSEQPRGELVSGATPLLLLLGNALLYAQPALFEANWPGYRGQPALHALLSAGWLLGAWPRTGAAGLCMLLVGHGLLGLQSGATWTSYAMLAASPLCLERAPRAAASSGATRERMPALGAASCVALFYLSALSLVACPTGFASRPRQTARRMLAAASLLPPRAADAGAWHAPAVALLGSGGRTQALPDAFAEDSMRAQLLRSYLGGRPWQAESGLVATARDGLHHALAFGTCARAGEGASFALQDSRGEPLLRFVCEANPRRARLLPRAGYEGELRLASDPALELPAVLPAALSPGDFVGSQRCASCHTRMYAAWRASGHARSLRRAGDDELGAASRATAENAVHLTHTEHGLRMHVTRDGRAKSYAVDRVLGSGEQWQAYLTGEPQNRSLLPWIFLRRARRWAPVTELYRELHRPGAADRPQPLPLELAGCLQCHATGLHVTAESAERAAEQAFREAGVGCEACHGPGRAHAERHDSAEATRAPDPYAGQGAARAQRACDGCHGPAARARFHGGEGPAPASLEHADVAATGEALSPEHQQPAFAMSLCHRRGAASCISCHAPHAAENGELRPGARCLGCHARFSDPEARRSHAPHPTVLECRDCHMPQRWLRGAPELAIRVTGHALAPPRPAEAELLGTSDACTGCHRERSHGWALDVLARWGARRSTAVRPWVGTAHAFVRARFAPAHTADADGALGALSLEDNETLLLGVLRLLERMRAEPRLVPRLSQLAEHARADIRGAARRALATHDTAGAQRWLAAGASDSHPLTRMLSLGRLLDLRALNEEQQRRYLRDLLDHAAEPVPELLRLSRLRRLAGERKEALALLELAIRYAPSLQRARLIAERTRLERRAHP